MSGSGHRHRRSGAPIFSADVGSCGHTLLHQYREWKQVHHRARYLPLARWCHMSGSSSPAKPEAQQVHQSMRLRHHLVVLRLPLREANVTTRRRAVGCKPTHTGVGIDQHDAHGVRRLQQRQAGRQEGGAPCLQADFRLAVQTRAKGYRECLYARGSSNLVLVLEPRFRRLPTRFTITREPSRNLKLSQRIVAFVNT